MNEPQEPNTEQKAVGSDALFGIWQLMEDAPKGGGADRVDDPLYVDPPRVLMAFDDGTQSVCYWDWYYAEGGRGWCGLLAWVDNGSGDLAERMFGNPVAWMPLPCLPNATAQASAAKQPTKSDHGK